MKHYIDSSQPIPECLSAKQYLFEKHFATCSHPLVYAVQRLLFASDYAARQLPVLSLLLAEDDCQRALHITDYQQAVTEIALTISPVLFAKKLRQFRHRHLLRLLLREYAGLADTSATIEQWSYCADALILHAKQFCLQACTKVHGEPVNTAGEFVPMYTIAMGKLGGNELNFSSDIDLIFTFSANGYTSSFDVSVSNQEFYAKVIQQFLRLMQQITEDGFVFRVDLRLRPNGDSGPLVLSFAAMETYYQEQGRDWERYAMIKARLIEQDAWAQQWFVHLIRPFVYRRYIDYSVIESMKTMKAMIEREIMRNAMPDDIKRGQGGIREIEFMIQSLQLIRGGRTPHIQQQNALSALSSLQQEGFIAKASILKRAYLFLRQLENALQTENDKQTHTLPTGIKSQTAITMAMGMNHWEDVLNLLHRYQRVVSQLFRTMLNHPDDEQTQRQFLANQLMSVWQGHVEEQMAINLLFGLNYQQPERCYRMLVAFRNTPRCRRLTHSVMLRLDRLMVVILNALVEMPDTDKVLLQVLHLLENIVGRSAYLALLLENPPVLHEVLHWFLHSPFITTLIVTYPFLLEVFIDQNKSWRLPGVIKLKNMLTAKLAHTDGDVEQQDDVFRQFKWMCTLLAARAQWYEQYDCVIISRFLTHVAQVMISSLVDVILMANPGLDVIKSRFAIIAYGTLGSYEMNYHSDLDLVFLHQVSATEEHLVTRLTQKILHRLTTRTQFGVLYAVDTRLRPSGSAGLLISHMDAYMEYQLHTAWTWEHQALLKARLIVSTRDIKIKFLSMKRSILQQSRDKNKVCEDVLSMRERISKHKSMDMIKSLPGGLLDLEFLVQYLILISACDVFFRYTHTLMQIRQLMHLAVLSQSEASDLHDAYCQYQTALHYTALQEKTSPVSMASCQEKVLHLMQLYPRV